MCLLVSSLAMAQQMRGAQIKNNTVALNVKDYGATGNGTTSDYRTIQNAVNRSNALITIPNGTYLIDTPITVHDVSNLRITGNSGATLQGTKHMVFILGVNCNNVEIDGVAFSTTAADSTTVDYYGLISDTSAFTNVYIHNCSFTAPHCQTNGIKVICEHANTASYLTVQNCTFTNIGKMGIELQNHTDTVVYRLNNINISNNYFNNLGTITGQAYGMAISLTGIGKGAVVTGNVVIDPRDIGIECAGWSDVTIANNTIRGQKNNSFSSIHVTDNSFGAYPRRVSVTGNISENLSSPSTVIAILTQNLNDYSITANVVKQAGGTNIGLFTSYGGVVSGNSLTGGTSTVAGGGILFTGSSYNLVSGNFLDMSVNPAYAIAIYYNASGSTNSTNNTVEPDNVMRMNSTGISFQQAAGGVNNTLSLGDDPLHATDADYTVARSRLYIILPTVTANRFVTVPSAGAYPGESLFIQNSNTSAGFNWSFATGVVTASGAFIGGLTNSTFYQLKSNGQYWVKMN
ncbi:MAG: hypothetical protein JWR02_3033 [Mucilaginibacter sp.]|nr:hypothetical protein [Mucilaginibacter sp.]